MFLIIYMHLYSIVQTVLYVFYEAISNKSVYSYTFPDNVRKSLNELLETLK